MLLSETAKIILGSTMLVLFALSALSNKYPDVKWLRGFRLPQLSAEQQARQRRRANVYAGAELILLGLCIPLGYFALTIMFFNEIERTELLIVGGIAVLCIALGVFAIARNARAR